MRLLTLGEAQTLRFALDDLTGYLTDNSCSDPDCCGGPYYEQEQFDEALVVLSGFGLGYQPAKAGEMME